MWLGHSDMSTTANIYSHIDIRNAIAHGNVYYFNAGNRKFILFEDFNEKSKPTARILFSQTDLKKLKDALLR